MLEINGQTADLFLGHPDLNSGDPYPFLLWKREKPFDTELQEEEGPALSVQIEVDQDADPLTMRKAFYFTVLLKDHSFFTGKTFTQEDQREILYNVLGQGTRIFIQSDAGAYAALEADGHVVTETQYENYALAQVRLTSSSGAFQPAPNDQFQNSQWLAPDYTAGYYSQLVFEAHAWAAGISIIPWTNPTPFVYLFRFLAGSGGDPYLQALISSANKQYIFEFEIVNAALLDFNAGDYFYCFVVLENTTNKVVVQLKLDSVSGDHQIMLTAGGSSTSWYTIPSTGLTTIKLKIATAASAVSVDGSAELYIDTVLKETLSSLDNYENYTSFCIGFFFTAITASNNYFYVGDIRFADTFAGGWTKSWLFYLDRIAGWGDGNLSALDYQAYWR